MINLLETMRNAIEEELQKQVARLDAPRTKIFHEMMTYHLGWTGEGAGAEATGKRIRPILVLLATSASQNNQNEQHINNWQAALPGAAAVELIHNFSLIHDDIQDNSEKRRGRPTIWVKWGMPQAINAGDGMFVLANQACLDLQKTHPANTVLKAAELLQQACLDLTRGQYLDISYENRLDLGVEDYWPMISGKTAALLSTCCELGALLGGADEPTREAYRSFGHYLGLAFQVQDDLLGIWGDEALTGKSASNDLVSGKKSLPVLAGLEKNGKFAERWKQGPISSNEAEEIARILASEGAYTYTHEYARQLTDMAITSLREADPQGEAGEMLGHLTDQLLKRDR